MMVTQVACRSCHTIEDVQLPLATTMLVKRLFELQVDPVQKTISLPRVLPGVPAELYTDFKEFVREHHAANLPLHRRIETTKARLRCANHRGHVSLTITVKDGDYEYALQRLIHLVHETFLIFLANGAYRDYRIAQLGVDPDWG